MHGWFGVFFKYKNAVFKTSHCHIFCRRRGCKYIIWKAHRPPWRWIEHQLHTKWRKPCIQKRRNSGTAGRNASFTWKARRTVLTWPPYIFRGLLDLILFVSLPSFAQRCNCGLNMGSAIVSITPVNPRLSCVCLSIKSQKKQSLLYVTCQLQWVDVENLWNKFHSLDKGRSAELDLDSFQVHESSFPSRPSGIHLPRFSHYAWVIYNGPRYTSKWHWCNYLLRMSQILVRTAATTN